MILTLLKGKIHRACVTRCDLNYEGSISIDKALMNAADILPHEQVDVLNIDSGARFTTYAISASEGSGVIGINGAAARLVQNGDRVIIIAYCQIERNKAVEYKPKTVLVDEKNKILK